MPDARRLARMLLGALLAALGLFLLLQPGNSIDEGEHLHVAWLIAARGLHPVRDFFEHHTPGRWHVLGLAYRAGVKGPEVLYVGRVLVVACAAVWCWTLASLVKRWSRGADALPLPGVFSVAAFAAVSFVTPEL